MRTCANAEDYCVDGKISVSTRQECYDAVTNLGAAVYQYTSVNNLCKYSFNTADCDEEADVVDVVNNAQIYDINSVDGADVLCMIPTTTTTTTTPP